MDSVVLSHSTEAPSDVAYNLVLEYLKKSGRTKAAMLMAEEHGSRSNSALGALEVSQGEIRRKILNGKIVEAVESINDLASDILDTNTDLMFKLKIQAFIEMVRRPGYDVGHVLGFASEELVPCPQHLLHNLEEAMALLAFENPADSPMKGTLNRRSELANEVNSAILDFYGSGEPYLVQVLRRAHWLEEASMDSSRFGNKGNSNSIFRPDEDAQKLHNLLANLV